MQNAFLFPKKSNSIAESKGQRYQSFEGKRKKAAMAKKPIERLNELLVNIDICRFIRINWLLSPMINARSVKLRLFNFNYYQVRQLIDNLEDPVKKAICLFLADDLFECMKICQQCRSIYLK
jgi:hypothetical protein